MNLLLAEDDPVTAAFIAEVLATAGHCVSHASDAQAALELARTRRFDRLMLDLNLPGMRADQLLATLRDPLTAAASRDATAIALSADLQPETRSALLGAGFETVAGKPIAAAALVALVAGTTPTRATAATIANGDDLRWDDAAALAMCAGNRQAVTALRGLFVAELPQQRARLRAAFASHDSAAASSELHRLRAACGFCGARQLGALATRIDGDLAAGRHPAQQAIDALDRACTALLED